MLSEENRVKFHLWVAGLNQTDLAERAGLSPGTISAVVHRNRATEETKTKIAAALNVTQEEIFPNERRK